MEQQYAIYEVRVNNRKVHFATLMVQTIKGRVVLRGDNVTDDTGVYAVFTEQGASASHMCASKALYVDEINSWREMPAKLLCGLT